MKLFLFRSPALWHNASLDVRQQYEAQVCLPSYSNASKGDSGWSKSIRPEVAGLTRNEVADLPRGFHVHVKDVIVTGVYGRSPESDALIAAVLRLFLSSAAIISLQANRHVCEAQIQAGGGPPVP